MRDACRRSRIDFRDVQTTPVGPCLHTVLHEVGQPALHADFLDLLLVSTRKSDFRLGVIGIELAVSHVTVLVERGLDALLVEILGLALVNPSAYGRLCLDKQDVRRRYDGDRRVLRVVITRVERGCIGIVGDVRLIDAERHTHILAVTVRLRIRLYTGIVVGEQLVKKGLRRGEVITCTHYDVVIQRVLVHCLVHEVINQSFRIVGYAPVGIRTGKAFLSCARVHICQLDGHHHAERGVQLLPVGDVTVVKDVVVLVKLAAFVKLRVSLGQFLVKVRIDFLLRIILWSEVPVITLQCLRIRNHAEDVSDVHVVVRTQGTRHGNLVLGTSERQHIALVLGSLIGVQRDDLLQILDISVIIGTCIEVLLRIAGILDVLTFRQILRKQLCPGVIVIIVSEYVRIHAGAREEEAGLRGGRVVRVDGQIIEITATAQACQSGKSQGQ